MVSQAKKLISRALGEASSRIKVSPEAADRLAEVATRSDARSLLKEGVVTVEPKRGNSRGRWRLLHEKKRNGRRRGQGKRRGPKSARMNERRQWINRVRNMRRFLNYLKHKGTIDSKTWRRLYLMVKGGYFESLSSLRAYMIQNHIIEGGR
ncbi:50S ribosomal protein L19e [Thermocladium modestius]|uniref:Large ribosomal subunit protein eL19 n=1 Tax=Thermocladium modestius TaxID=62609 RepID=A0A830GVC9_9CREN|nr:50S ribosomal protein L19e [Thermocladium modestius]GGP21967.1 50S ribosomal protein L19e [Thermocladium modestius]